MLTPFKADHIRTLYASGLYHKSDIYLRFIYELKTPDTLIGLLTYKIFPEVRPELRLPIFGMAYVFEASEDYHNALRLAAMEEHDAILEDPKDAAANFANIQKHTKSKLRDKLVFINREFETTFTVFDIQSRLYRDV